MTWELSQRDKNIVPVAPTFTAILEVALVLQEKPSQIHIIRTSGLIIIVHWKLAPGDWWNHCPLSTLLLELRSRSALISSSYVWPLYPVLFRRSRV